MIKLLQSQDIIRKLSEKSYKQQNTYLLMYSSWYEGFTKDPSMMLIPVDDHQVHRGDAVFEAIKVINSKIFLLEPHLARLHSSANKVGISLDNIGGLEGIREKILQCLRLAEVSECMIRLFVARGPGGFTTNPYDSVGTQLYIIITKWTPMAEQKYNEGVLIGKSEIPPKESWMAQVKSCNYLPNVMMKKEAVDRGLDFTVSFDAQGNLTESSTENIVILTKDKMLLRPEPQQILRGTTMMRVFEIAESLKSTGEIRECGVAQINEAMLRSAQEVMMIGTTLDVLPVQKYEDHIYGNLKAAGFESRFPVAYKLCQKLREDFK